MKKVLFSFLLLSLVFFSSSAFAQGGWGAYYVTSSGPYQSSDWPQVGNILSVQLTPVAGGNATFFRLNADREKELLAIALTALSANLPVWTRIEVKFNNGHWSDYEVTSMFSYDSEQNLP